MATTPDKLAPPRKTDDADPGAHDLETSDSEDHFSDAKSAPASPARNSPIPKTRVEKVTTEPAYGETPGTEAYRKRENDAEPDEIAIIPEESSDPSPSHPPSSHSPEIPTTVVIESAGTTGPHSPRFEERLREEQKADAKPDVVLKPDEEEQDMGSSGESDTSIPSPNLKPLHSPELTRNLSSQSVASTSSSAQDRDPKEHSDEEKDDEEEQEDEEEEEAGEEGEQDDEDGDDDFGDDFDDFEEGAEDADFDDFEDGFQQPEPVPSPAPAAPTATAVPVPSLPFSIPDFEGLEPDEVTDALDPYIHYLFPPENHDTTHLPPVSKDQPVFLTARSASLWSQLVAPPPISSGLDPVSNNASSTSVDSQGPSASQRRKGPPPEPNLNLVSAKQLCTTTDEALDGMTNGELKSHLDSLTQLQARAKEALDYWQKRTDEKIGDREAFEGVIENLPDVRALMLTGHGLLTISEAFPPTMGQLGETDPKDLDVGTLSPLTPEIIARQATINIGTIGHVAHGKSTVVKAISGVQTVRFKNELIRNITIKLGYANAKIYQCDNKACPRPTCYRSYKSDKEVDPPCEREGCSGTYRLLRHVSFVDCPGHDILMSTMLSGAAVMDAALLLIAGNESCPQPQTSEHLAAIEIMKLDKIIILQNKVDLMRQEAAEQHYQSILKFIRDFTLDPYMIVIRSFDVNKPGAEIHELKGGVAGGSILHGVLKLGDEVEIRPGIVTRDDKGALQCKPIFSRIVTLNSEANDLKYAVPGGLIGVGTRIDPTLCRADRLVGHVLGLKGRLPEIYSEIEINFYLLRRLLGVRTADGKQAKVAKLSKNEVIMVNIGSTSTGAKISAHKNDAAKLVLTTPACTNIGEKVALSRRIEKHWRLIGWATIVAGVTLEPTTS
ncbi:unnamed protein product [Parascedosporium putredinis]|uniref:Eukaryotic translation initiation factor 2 subunit gamma n=1 Tax=Parascedosporium putredinis TaxID=1442378 RepID=A0A9P1H6Z4_9PEZI|nr:unnamed protein product [Parascedosporium putredinis]CAI7998149.1 unnamed protein product [Parascedosporium putredinis]